MISRGHWLGIGLLALGGCGDVAGPSAFDDTVVYDLAVLAADATLEDVALWAQPFVFGPLLSPGPVLGPGRPGGHHGWSGELSGTRSVTFYDVDGIEQTEYDPLLTEIVHLEHEVMGDVTREDFAASVHRTRFLDVSGLSGEETQRTWNGTGSEEVSRDRFLDGGLIHSYDATGSVTYEDVVVPIPGTEPPYPLSGTIRRTMAATVTDESGEHTRDVAILITFDGTSTPTASVNGEEVQIDLAAQEGQHPLHRPRT